MASTNVTHGATAQDGERKKRKRAAIVKFGLVGAALVGIGAAATSAAWTDDAWFNATATAATIELEGQRLDTRPTRCTWDVAGPTRRGSLVDPRRGLRRPGARRDPRVHRPTCRTPARRTSPSPRPSWTPSTTARRPVRSPAAPRHS